VLHTTVADETAVDNPTGYSPLSTVAPLAVAQAAGGVLGATPGRLTGEMCLRITFDERPGRPARFCNRYVASQVRDPDAGPLGNEVAFDAAIDVLDAVTLIETYTGPPPHVRGLEATVDLHRGERLAYLRRVKAPKRVRPGSRVKVRVTLQRIRGKRFTRTERIRIPSGVKPGKRALTLRGKRGGTLDDGLLEIILGGDFGGPGSDPVTVDGLISAIRALERWDGVQVRLAGERRRGFRDDSLVLAGRAKTMVRVVQPSKR
jgi:hypothetical protein